MKLTQTIKSWFAVDERPTIGRLGAPAPSTAFDAMDFSFLSLRDILSSGVGVVATRLHIITLRSFREAIGAAAWNRFVRTVHSIAEGVIRRHLGRGDLCGRSSDDTFILAFNALPENKARRIVRIIAADLMHKLIGDRFQGAQIMVAEVDAATIIKHVEKTIDEEALEVAIDGAEALEQVEAYELAAAGVRADPRWQDMIIAHEAGDPVWMELAIGLYRDDPHWRSAAARLVARDPRWANMASRLDLSDPGWRCRLADRSADDPSWLVGASASGADVQGTAPDSVRRWRDFTSDDGGGPSQPRLITGDARAVSDTDPAWRPLRWPPEGWQTPAESAHIDADMAALPDGATMRYRPAWRRHCTVVDTYLCVAECDAGNPGGTPPATSTQQQAALNLALIQATMRQLNEDTEARRCSTLILPIKLSLLADAYWAVVRALLREASDAARQRYLLVEVVDIPLRTTAASLIPIVRNVRALCRDVLLQTPNVSVPLRLFKACSPLAVGFDAGALAADETAVGDRIGRLAVESGGVSLYVWGVDRSSDFAKAAAAGCIYLSGGAVGRDSTAPRPEASLLLGSPDPV